MTEKEALDFLNDTPYYYNSIGMGVALREKVDGVQVCIRRNKEKGGINFFCELRVFHFFWDTETQKWVSPASKMASVS